jgi:hypothetical protein
LPGKAYLGEKAILSLTSGRAGIDNVGLCIYSILAYSRGFHIRLTVSSLDFYDIPGELPDDLRTMVGKRIIECAVTDEDIKTSARPLFSMDRDYGCPVLSIDSSTVYDFDYPGELYRICRERYGIQDGTETDKPEDGPQLIVSLTTWKGRIGHPEFPDNLRSLLEQDTGLNYRVCLVLSREEFGYGYELPGNVRELLGKYRHFEVIWTWRNTKALKNYDPTVRKYPELPVVVLGDDTIYDRKLVSRVWKTWLGSDRRTCFGAAISRSHERLGILSPYRIRLFPPHCMAYVDEEYFMRYFHGHNDLFNGVRMWLAGTKVAKADWDGLWHRAFAQEVRLKEYHTIPEWKVVEDFIKLIN